MEIIIGILLAIILFFVIIMIVDGNRFVIKEYTLESDKVETEQKIAVLADLHNKKYGSDNETLIKAIRNVNPDIVLAAGDILTAKPGKSYETAASFMEKIAAEYPVYYGLGNHEYRMKIYPEDYGDMFDKYISRLKKAGIIVLDNETAEIKIRKADTAKSEGEYFSLRITGVSIERLYYKRFRKIKMEDSYLKGLLGNPKKDAFEILLVHNPEYFSEYASWGADLVLSGHVHGGIMKLPVFGGVISPKLVLFPKYDGGMFKEKGSTMILSRGLGMHTIPIRIFNPGELVVVHLLPCKSK